MTDSFDLTPATGPPEGYLMPRAAADALGVSTVTLANWRGDNKWDKELAVEGESKHGPTWFYHVERVRAWMKVHRSEGNGGTREGAGRPRKETKRPARAGRDEETKGEEAKSEPPPLAIVAAANRAERDRKDAEEAELQRKNLTDPLAIAQKAGSTDLARREVQNTKDLMSAARTALDIQKELGELVDKAQTRREVVEQLSRGRSRLMGLENGWTDRVMLTLKLGADGRPTVAAMIQAMLRDACEAMRTAEA